MVPLVDMDDYYNSSVLQIVSTRRRTDASDIIKLGLFFISYAARLLTCETVMLFGKMLLRTEFG